MLTANSGSSVLWNASGCNGAQNGESGWYIKTDGLSCRVVLSRAGYHVLISRSCCDCLDAGIHYVVMGRKHNVKRDLGAGDTKSNECVASLV